MVVIGPLSHLLVVRASPRASLRQIVDEKTGHDPFPDENLHVDRSNACIRICRATATNTAEVAKQEPPGSGNAYLSDRGRSGTPWTLQSH